MSRDVVAGAAVPTAPETAAPRTMASSEPCSTPAAAGAAAWTQGLPSAARAASYGVFALPLAFAALPLYVQWPAHAAGTWGLPLALVGALLLGVRVFDAFVDPWIGARVDRLFARSFRLAWAAAGAAAACIALGVAALMFAPPEVAASQAALLAWAGAALVVTSLGYSVAMVTHQAWAVRLGGGTAEQARWVGAREALALVGVIVASVLPSAYGWSVTVGVLAVLLALAWLALGRVPPGARGDMAGAHPAEPGRRESDRSDRARSPWHDRGFRKLMSVVLVSGLASAIPASLVVLYVRDVLQAGSAAEGWVLGLYFAAAALGMPLWVRVIRRHGLVRPWLAGMVLSVAAFAGAATLGPGEAPLFALVCVASGLALGADLVAPPALLAALIRQRARLRGAAGEPHTGEHEGVEGLWFGWWNFATKLTLAAAAGLALPLVQWLGYAPGDHSAASLAALAWCYALLPCAVKGVAAALLWIHRHGWPLDATGGENLADLRLS